jgi:SpoVK/Ycf46/Vps4 family AAA+-type ATPase
MGVEILIEMPDECQRYEIMRALGEKMSLHADANDNLDDLCKFIAESTTGFVGADIEKLIQFVLRENKSKIISIRQHFENALKIINPSVMHDNLGTLTRSTMKLNDIGGMDEMKKTLITSVLGPLKHADKFARFGLKSPAGILLYGPSGCAKTTIVKCLAGESKMTLISVSSAEIYSPYVGEAEKFIVKLFNQARMSAPTILFFDEIDTIVGNRSKTSGANDSHMRILSTLLTEIDGFNGGACASINKPILIIGATNRPDSIDDALMRPGRFDKLIHVPAPDFNYRCQILKFLLNKMPVADDVNIDAIAEETNLFSGADLVNLCNEAALYAATRDLNCDEINFNDFKNVLTFLRPSLSEEKIKFYENYEKRHGKSA